MASTTPDLNQIKPAGSNYDEYINKMYDSSLNSQKQTLEQNYNQNLSALDTQQQKLQQQTDANLTRTYVEAAKAAKNYGEVQNAYGLSSGAMAQAKLAQNNQLNADLTALRGVQAEADAQMERDRTLLSQEYASAIAKAQADNDYQRAQALYQEAQRQDDRLLNTQLQLANIYADKAGDYSLLYQLYGLTPEQIAALKPAPVYSGGGGSGGGGGMEDSGSEGEETGRIFYEEYAPGIDTIRNQGSIKGSAWDYTKNNYEQLLRSGMYNRADEYLKKIDGQPNQKQIDELNAIYDKYAGKG